MIVLNKYRLPYQQLQSCMDPGIFDCGSEQHVGWAPILWPSNNETDDQPIDLGHIWARYFQAKLYFRAFNAVSPCVFKQEGGLAIKTGLQGSMMISSYCCWLFFQRCILLTISQTCLFFQIGRIDSNTAVL